MESDDSDVSLNLAEYWFNNVYMDEVINSNIEIQHLPPELITTILENLSSKYLLTVVRLVSRDFQDIVLNIIHRRFLLLSKKFTELCKHLFLISNVPRPLDIRLGEYDLIHYLIMTTVQYCTLHASIWRYMKNGSSGLVLCHCPSTIFDAFENILYKIKHQSLNLQVNSNLCQDVDRLCYLVRSFIDKFEFIVEAKLNTNCFVTGAKIMDLLESDIYCDSNILSESYENGICKMKGAWFNVTEIENEFLPHYSWEEDQRLMYNRLRRLLVTHANIYSESARSNLKTELDPDREAFYRPSLGAYAAVEEYANRSYYFGCMLPEINDEAEDNGQFLDVTVHLVCPIRYAPLSVYQTYGMDLKTKYLKKHIVHKATRLQASKFFMNVQFNCHLPGEIMYAPVFNFVVSEEERIENTYKNNLLI